MSQKIIPMVRCPNAKRDEMVNFYLNILPWAERLKENGWWVSLGFLWGEIFFHEFGPEVKLNHCASFTAWLKDEDMTKEVWNKLSEGGKVLMEFWSYDRSSSYWRCNDKYGLSRQIMFDQREDHPETLVPGLLFTLQFAGKAEQAMEKYITLFPKSKVIGVYRNGPEAWEAEWSLAHAEFELVGNLFIVLDSFLEKEVEFNEWVSFFVSCADKNEYQRYVSKLTENWWFMSDDGFLTDEFWVSRVCKVI